MPETGWSGLITAVAALAGVLGALVLLLRGLNAAGRARAAGRRLAVEEAVALDARRRLVIARCDGRALLLLTGGGQDVVVGWLPAPDAENRR
jgi:flagellar protein FliO/FliZ